MQTSSVKKACGKTGIALAGILLLGIASCKKHSSPPGPVVYVTGSKDDRAVYWKNGVIHYLTDTTLPQWSYAGRIIFSGTDMYMSGAVETFPNNTNDMRAVYWKNGVMTSLPSSTQSNAGAILVTGNDVYVSGSVFSYTGEFGHAAYWKNGVFTMLSQDTSMAAEMATNGIDLYIAGSETINGVTFPTVWIDGFATHLTHDTSGTAIGIGFSGNQLLVAGTLRINNQLNAVCWKNGVPTILGPVFSINDMCISNGDVYIAGFKNTDSAHQAGVFWKDGLPTQLPVQSEIAGVYAYGASVYLAGGIDQPGRFSGAAYWNNGAPTDLSPGGVAIGIAVRPSD